MQKKFLFHNYFFEKLDVLFTFSLLKIVIQIDEKKKILSTLPTFKTGRKLKNALVQNEVIRISYFGKGLFI